MAGDSADETSSGDVEADHRPVAIGRGFGERPVGPDPRVLMTSLNYGYVIHDRPKRMTALSLVLGYNRFPEGNGTDALNAMVYGVEYAHTFFKHKPVSLLLDYGLLFNLIKQANLDGYAFGHHTRLSIGGVYNLSDEHKVALKGAYNFVTFPYFDLSDARITYPSVGLRYYFYY
jgi:hypothetical protein